jgi:hypothetical protein
LHNLQLVFTASFESTGVVEDITEMICKGELIVDAVLATLQARFPRSAAINNNNQQEYNKHVQPPLWRQVEEPD